MLYVGIDWSERKHDVCIDNHRGATITRFSIPHSWDGFQELDHKVREIAAAPADCILGIETGYNIIVDFLMGRGYAVNILPPRTTRILRRSKRASGAYDDRSDAQLIANTLRTRPDLLTPWHPNSALTQQISAHVTIMEQLKRTIHQMQARLRAALMRSFPTALDIFRLQAPIFIEFLAAFPTYREAYRLSQDEFVDFFAQRGYRRTDLSLNRYRRLQLPCAQATPATVAAHRGQILLWAQILLSLRERRKQAQSSLSQLFCQHPDQHIFASLPGAGRLLAPALLSKFGDHRERFPDASVAQAFAGTCPVTYSSGKSTVTHYRVTCDHDFRRITQQFALCSAKYCDWASAYRLDAFRRCKSMSQATRMLANRWMVIIWKMWQTRQPYDNAYHLKQRSLHRRHPNR